VPAAAKTVDISACAKRGNPDDRRGQTEFHCFGEPAHGFLVRQNPCDTGGKKPWRRTHRSRRRCGRLREFPSLEPRGITLAIEGLVVMKNIESRAFEAGQHAQYGPAVSECLFMRAYSSGSRRVGLRRMASGIPILPMSLRSAATSRFCSFSFFESQFLSRRACPIPQAACYARRLLRSFHLLSRGAG